MSLKPVAEFLDFVCRATEGRTRVVSSAKTRAVFNTLLATLAHERQASRARIQARFSGSLGS